MLVNNSYLIVFLKQTISDRWIEQILKYSGRVSQKGSAARNFHQFSFSAKFGNILIFPLDACLCQITSHEWTYSQSHADLYSTQLYRPYSTIHSHNNIICFDSMVSSKNDRKLWRILLIANPFMNSFGVFLILRWNAAEPVAAARGTLGFRLKTPAMWISNLKNGNSDVANEMT